MVRISKINRLEKELNDNYYQACSLGYTATIYKRLLKKYIGYPLAVVDTILTKEYKNNKPLPGFIRLVDIGRIDLTLEYTMYKKCYRSLLSEQQKMVIVSLLHEYGNMTFKQIQQL